MHKLLHILAKNYSILLHPLLMPTYGMGLYCVAISLLHPELSIMYSIVAILGTMVLTLIIPASIILYLWKTKRITSLHIDNPQQRTAPYIYTIMAYGFWAYLVGKILHLPSFMLLVALGAIFALIIVTIVNLWWKISAHLTGIGGLLGGICSFALYYAQFPIGLMLVVTGISLFLMYARLYLDAHTPLQVVCGFLLGLLSTFIPNLIAIYA